MASPKPPAPDEVPETAATYERSNVDSTLKREDAESDREQSDDARSAPLPSGGKIAGNMKTEEPDGWDQAPMDIKDPRQQRHPRPDGVGGSEPDSAKRDPKR